MRNRNILFICLIIFSFLVLAEDWKEKHRELCSYDKLCKTLIDSDGTFLKPKPEIILALKVLNPIILETAKIYNVDPRAIAGSILSENSLNCTITDDIQNWLVKLHIAKDGSLLGKKFSFGWGQLYMDAAMEAEPLAAKTEKRKERTAEEMAQDLLKPDKSIMHVGAVIRFIQDNYKKAGFDISDKPEILTTLYNLGGSGARAKTSKSLNRDPRVNYFGFFTKMNLNVLDDIVKPNETSKVSSVTDKLGFEMNNNLALRTGPTVCDASETTDVDYFKMRTMRFYPETQTVQKGQKIQILSTGLDCDLNEWRLVGDSMGNALGWQSLDLIKQNGREIVFQDQCKREINTECLDFVKSIYKDQFIEKTDEGKVLVKFKGRQEKVDWMQPAIGQACMPEHNKSLATDITNILNENDIGKLKKGIEDFKKKVEKIVSTDSSHNRCFNCSGNPYHFIDSVLSLSSLDSCVVAPEPSQGKIACRGDVDLFLHKINELTFISQPGWGDIKKINSEASACNGLVYPDYNVTVSLSSLQNKDQIIATMFADLNKCKQISGGLKKSSQIVDDLLKDINPQSVKASYVVNRSYITKMGDFCDRIKSIYISNIEKDCVNCGDTYTTDIYVYMPTLSPYNSSQTSVNLSEIKNYVKNEGDKDAFLADQLGEYIKQLNQNYSGGFNSSGDIEAVCSYLPKETGDQIEKLLENSCVKKIFVPDYYLLGRFVKNATRVNYHAFIENDRYMIDIGESKCEK